MTSLIKILLYTEVDGIESKVRTELKKIKKKIEVERVYDLENLKKSILAKKWNAVIIDVDSPCGGLSFVELIKKIKKPAVICIAEELDDEMVVASIKAGAHEYIKKSNLVRLKKACQGLRTSGKISIGAKRKKLESMIDAAVDLDRVFSSLNFLIAFMDAEFNFIKVNDAYAASTGNDPEFFVGKNHFDVYPHEENKRIFQNVVKSGKPYITYGKPFEYPNRPEFGTTYRDWILQPIKNKKGKTENIVLCLIDVTAREKALTRQRLLSTAIEIAEEGVLIVDRNRTIQYVNKAFAEAMGYRKEELLDRNSEVLRSRLYDEKYYEELIKHLSQGKIWKGQYERERKDGTRFFVDQIIYPLLDENGKILSYVVVERDITEDLRMQKQLVQSQKMEALGILASGVSHDFNNILMPIIINAEMVLWDTPENSKAQKYLESILAAATRGRELVKQILAFSRPTPLSKRPVDVIEIIEEALSFVSDTLPANIEISKNIRTEKTTVMADRFQLSQVVVNLINNAVWAIGDGKGKIRIDLDDSHLDDKTSSFQTRSTSGNFLKFSITDDGIGISPDNLDKIFIPFYSTKSKSKGTGLGLSLVHSIIIEHGGFINVYSELDKGSEFEVILPRTELIGEKEPINDQELVGGDEHILLVEDEIELLETLKELFVRLGYNITAHKNAEEALDVFRESAEEFDIVISDQVMPHMSGTDLAQKIREIRVDIPIVLYSGYRAKIDKKDMEHLGINEIISKPLNTEELACTIRRVLDLGQTAVH